MTTPSRSRPRPAPSAAITPYPNASIGQAIAADSWLDLRSDRLHTESPVRRGADCQSANRGCRPYRRFPHRRAVCGLAALCERWRRPRVKSLCWARLTVDTEPMVTFRREVRLWRETSVTQRALMIRDDADTYWLACQM